MGKKAKDVSQESKSSPSLKNSGVALNPVPKIVKVSNTEKSPLKEPREISKNEGQITEVSIPKDPKNEPEISEESNENQPAEQINKLGSVLSQQSESKTTINNNQHQLGPQITEQQVTDKSGQTIQQKTEELGGMIFLCNNNTKSDIFRYMVMGFPENRKDLVMGIKPNLKLFLYDYHHKVLHGIYKATSPGGMRLEPAAFNGFFPAQVRFMVEKEFSPLPFYTLTGLLDNFDGRTNMVKSELTTEQVLKLTGLFFLNTVESQASNPTQSGQNGANPSLPPPNVPGQTLPPVPLNNPLSLIQRYGSARALSVPLTSGVPMPALSQNSNIRVPAGSLHFNNVPSAQPHMQANCFQPQVQSFAPPRLPTHALPSNNIPSNIQTQILQPQVHTLAPSHFPTHALPPPSNLNHGSLGFHQSMPAGAQAAGLMVPVPVPVPVQVPLTVGNQKNIQVAAHRPKRPADPANMPVSHKYIFELNSCSGGLSSQQSVQPISQLASKQGGINSPAPVSSQMPYIPTEVPIPNHSKVNETNHIQGLQSQALSLASGHLLSSRAPVPELNPGLGRTDPYPSHLPQGLKDVVSSVALPHGASYATETVQPDSSLLNDKSRTAISDRMLPGHGSDASAYDRRQQKSIGNLDTDSLPVSSRYSFDGPSVKYR